MDLGLQHFFSNLDGFGRALVAVLLAMSVASWSLILSRSWERLAEARRSQRFMRDFDPRTDAAAPTDGGACERLTTAARAAGAKAGQLLGSGRLAADAADQMVAEAMARSIAEDASRRETGLTALASIGSSAPYVGLLGTVLGVYHALVAIGDGQHMTLDQVAGPVGEALVMTALGLAVAIPAVLAYNGLVRGNRVALTQLEGLASDLLEAFRLGSAGLAERQGVTSASGGAQ
jgi:biopolymer transport protein ExbB